MNKLFYAPGACSIGIHVLLEEIGKPYEAVATNLREGAQFKPEFVTVNPKSKVPTLQREDGSVLTEFPAIAFWLAGTNPEKHLLPADIEGQARALEAMDYAVSTLHMQAFSRLFRPSNFTTDPAGEAAVKAKGEEMVEKGFALFDKLLDGKDYVTGSFSVADAALFYVEFWWAGRFGKMLPPNCAAHYARMMARPAVQSVLKQEGLAA